MEQRVVDLAFDRLILPRRERDIRSLGFSCAYRPAARLPVGATGIYGTTVPLGTARFAQRDADDGVPQCSPIPPEPIPGWLMLGSLWPGERFVMRVPERWNGRLVVAGTPAQRSEFSGDRLWSDPLVARGYAYICGNKRLGDGAVLHAKRTHVAIEGRRLPYFRLGLRHGLTFWQHAPGHTLGDWLEEFLTLTELAREVIADLHGREPELTYAVGLSNGGYQVRRALESSSYFDGGLSWNAALWTPSHNVLRQLPAAIAAMEAKHPQRLIDHGFPPDDRGLHGISFYESYLMLYWRVTAWLHAVHLDPQTSLAYGDVEDPEAATRWAGHMGAWNHQSAPQIVRRIERFSNTGRLRAKLIDLASSHDYLTPPAMHFEPYRRLVEAAGASGHYRSAIIDGAQHVDALAENLAGPQAVVGHPRALEAFDQLVAWVEGDREPDLN